MWEKVYLEQNDLDNGMDGKKYLDQRPFDKVLSTIHIILKELSNKLSSFEWRYLYDFMIPVE